MTRLANMIACGALARQFVAVVIAALALAFVAADSEGASTDRRFARLRR